MKFLAGLIGLASLRVMTANASAPQLRALAAMLAALLSLVVAPSLAEANDDQALRSYVLTADKLQRFAELAATVKREKMHDPALRAEIAADRDSDSGGDTLAEGVAALRKHPVLLGYVHRAGLTDQDMILIPLVIMGAKLAERLTPEQRKTYPLSPASFDFVEHHQSEIAALSKVTH